MARAGGEGLRAPGSDACLGGVTDIGQLVHLAGGAPNRGQAEGGEYEQPHRVITHLVHLEEGAREAARGNYVLDHSGG